METNDIVALTSEINKLNDSIRRGSTQMANALATHDVK